MRKLLISILLASAAASPVFAQDNGRRHDVDEPVSADRQEAQEQRQQAREERQQAREQGRSERSAGGGNFERTQQQREHFEVRQQAEQQSAQQEQLRQRADGVSRWTRDNVQQSGETARWTRDPNQRSGETGRWTRDRTGWTDNRNGSTPEAGDFRQSDRPVPNVMRTRDPLVVSDTPREGTQPRLRTEGRRWASTNWNGNWRNDRRYDWRRHRDRHRSIFHLGFYYDPFGWSYRPYQIGWRLWPSYFGSRYWINDPYQYRLPYAPAGTVWVRYYNDALLVDRFSGEVIDVIRNFFW